MTIQHTMTVVQQLEAEGMPGISLSHFTAKLDLALIRAYGDNYNEPHEPEHFELLSVFQQTGPFIFPDKLLEWAEEWVYHHQEAIYTDCDTARSETSERLEDIVPLEDEGHS